MYSYFYDEIKPKYGDDVTVCATDTDSLLMEIKTRDVYRDMMDYKRLYDLSNYDKNHLLYDETNKGRIGTFKDETNCLPILAYVVGLRFRCIAICHHCFKNI